MIISFTTYIAEQIISEVVFLLKFSKIILGVNSVIRVHVILNCPFVVFFDPILLFEWIQY